MQDDLQKIVDRIPTIWGKYLAIGPGWNEIVIELDKDLAAIDPDYKIQQVKEKFGTLRYYCSPSKELSEADKTRFYALISAAESLSSVTCDRCGGPGKLQVHNGWWKTRCEEDVNWSYSDATE